MTACHLPCPSTPAASIQRGRARAGTRRASHHGLALVLALGLQAALALPALAQTASPKPAGAKANTSAAAGNMKAVIQMSDADPAKWNLALNNARNIQDDLGGPDGVDLEIVAYGPGIGMLKAGSPVAERIAKALEAGVKVVACENTMRNQKLTTADMLGGIGYVPAGVVEIMKRQHEGWAYLRP